MLTAARPDELVSPRTDNRLARWPVTQLMTRVVSFALGALLLALALSGCTAPGEQLVVNNDPGNFQLAGQVAGKSGTETYKWQNSANKASVSWGGQVASGSFSLTIKDADGQQVHSHSFGGTRQGSDSGATQTGTPGTWTIEVKFSSYTGQMALNVNSFG